jgi:hypothetical protein
MNPDAWASLLPRELVGAGISLTEQNVAETAFDLPVALRIIDTLGDSQVQTIVLGGDFWKKTPTGRFAPAYENWFVERAADESDESYSQRSLAVARGEITRRLTSGYWVTLTVEVPPES